MLACWPTCAPIDTMARDAVIVTSGGMDSTTMLYDYRDEIALAITFDYGSTQNERERRCAVLHCIYFAFALNLHSCCPGAAKLGGVSA